MSTRPPTVRIVEVGPRDGLQNVKSFVPTAIKLELVARLKDAGLQAIELTSAVSPKAIPQLADCQDVLSDSRVAQWQKQHDLRLPVLIPNLKGLDVALKYGVREVAVFVSATEAFSKANINCTVADGLERARKVADKARNAGVAVRGYVSCIFADPYSGVTDSAAVLRCVQELLDMGCYEISLGDTIGVGTAVDVRRLIMYLLGNGIPANILAGHFHDTYGQAVSNVWQAYECGITVFDSSVGGLGGCPFAPGAKGNVATEDLVYLFHQAGVHTGVNLAKLAETGSWISKKLTKPNDSRAGAAILAKSNSLEAIVNERRPAFSNHELIWTPEDTKGEVEVFRAGANLKFILNRPKNGNALTTSMISTLTHKFEQLRNDKSISRIIVTGSGKFFCTGMDLGKESSPVARNDSASTAQFERLTRLFEAIDRAPQVTIASLNGSAFGGGIGLAFACDIRFAVETAAVTLSEVKIGLCAATISKYVIREWGPAFAREAMLSARTIPVSELKARGVISYVAHDLKQLNKEVDRYVAGLAKAAPIASRMSKDLVRLDFVDAGGRDQAEGIKKIFEEMMGPSGEAVWGLEQFQAGKKTVNWDNRTANQAKAKL